MNDNPLTRRRVIQAMLATPVLAGLGSASAFGQDSDELITAADKALDVFDFERLARAKLPPAHFGYLATGVDGDATLKANAAGFSNYSLRVRRLVDVRKIDMSVNLFGTTWDSPIVIDPVGSQRAFHPDGELATARAAKSRKHLQILSTVSSTGVEDVAAARGAPIWYQLYPTDQWSVTQGLVRRAEAAGCPVLVLTVDLQGGSNRVTLARAIPRDSRDCTPATRAAAHGSAVSSPASRCSTASTSPRSRTSTGLDMNWDYLKRLRDIWPRKLVIKGIVTREDAELAVEHGVDGIDRLESRRARGRQRQRVRSTASRRSPPASGAAFPSRRWRLPPRHGHLQGARARRERRRHRPALHLGPCVVRAGRRRESPRYPARASCSPPCARRARAASRKSSRHSWWTTGAASSSTLQFSGGS